MSETYTIKRYSSDKIALLALFALSLVIARFIVSSKTAIVLSQPIILNHSGLSVALPTGKGWHSDLQWNFYKNSFVLSSVFMAGSRQPLVSASCQYILADTKNSPEQQFQKIAELINGTIETTNQTQTGTLTIDWAHLKKQQQPAFDMFFGTAELPDSRRLEIKVEQIIADTDMARSVFNQIVENIEFEDNQWIKAGTEIIEDIKNAGIDYLLDDRGRQDYFIIKSPANKPIGFTMDVIVEADTEDRFNIKAQSLVYVRGRGRWISEEVALFESDSSFNEFIWISESANMKGRKAVKIVLDDAGIMTIREISRQVKERKYSLGPAALPDVFSHWAISQMINNDIDKMIIDIIDAAGEITPTLISKIETEDLAKEVQAQYVLAVESLNQSHPKQTIYLNASRRVVKRVLRHEIVAAFERTTLEDIVKYFPEKADMILQKSVIPDEQTEH